MKIEIIKTVGAMEVVRVTGRCGPSMESLFKTAELPDYIGVRRRGSEDKESVIQGPFDTLHEAMDSARAQAHHLDAYED